MELGEECDCPHDVHGGCGEDEGGAPDTAVLVLACLVLRLGVCVFCGGRVCGFVGVPSCANEAAMRGAPWYASSPSAHLRDAGVLRACSRECCEA
jgi:hypothetical protein